MPKTYTVGHRPLMTSVQAWLLNLLGRSQPQTWPPRRKIG